MTTRLVDLEDAYDGYPGILIQSQDPEEDDLNIVTYLDEEYDKVVIRIYDANSGELDYECYCDNHDVELLIEALQRIQRVDVF